MTLALLSLFTTTATAMATDPGTTSVDFTGYMVDTNCWDKPGHLAPPTRNTPLDISPEQHTLQCMRDIQVCFDGLTLLDYDPPTQRYYAKYQFSASRNADGLAA